MGERETRPFQFSFNAMVKVDFQSGIDEAHYKSCISQKDCAKPRPTMYPSSPVHTVTTESFASKAPAAYDYLTSA